MGTLRVVNMIPANMSGESHQDSEPNLAVNPERPTDMVATAFTPGPLNQPFAPIYTSTDSGSTWMLRNVVPGNAPLAGTADISIGFATTGGVLYAGALRGDSESMNILRTADFTSNTPMTVLVERPGVDQPWVVADSVVASGAVQDRAYVTNNDHGQPEGRTATVDLSLDAATAPPPAGFTRIQLERRPTVQINSRPGQDAPPVRTALHPDGTVYAAFQRWASGTIPDFDIDVTVTRDDNWGSGPDPLGALVDSSDGIVGQRVASNRFIRFGDEMGQERLGADLAIAVDPRNSSTVWVAWCDRVGGPAGTDWTLHVSRSVDRGQTWSADVRTITDAKNPSLAVNANGDLGLLYQQFTGLEWITRLEVTATGWTQPAEAHILHRADASTPLRVFPPYLGDYVRLLAVGRDFHGVFCGNNTPDMANFPSGVTYQRAADWTGHTLLNTDGTPVDVSIDPFYFHWTDRFPPIAPQPIHVGPPIVSRGPIVPRTPIIIEPPATPPPRPHPRQPPTELDL